MSRLTRAVLVALSLAACHTGTSTPAGDTSAVATGAAVASAVPGWRTGATCYEVFVRSFYDSDGDGIGDLRGLTTKLDYINDGNPATTHDLGARCIWLMPVTESPSYHGYDVTNYYRVEPDYGTNDDFKALVSEAHRRGIAVLVDMVLNHVSSRHPYFQDALGGPGAPHRDWFRWAERKPAELGPWGQEVWHHSPVRDEYYYGVFWSGMPDLDYATPAVREEAKKIAAFWLTQMGVDGFRLDAVPYLVEEGTQQIGTAGTHAFLRGYAAAIRGLAPDAFTVGEVWDGIDVMLPYYPDQLESYFAFDLSDALLAAVRSGSAEPLLARYARYRAEVPAGRYATFLRNHDQTRTLTALGGDVARAKAAATLLLTLPGFPFVYYGEEIGMTGDKPDERIRTPMQWSAVAGGGFTRGTPWESLAPDWPRTTVAAQDSDDASLLERYRELIRLRASNEALGSGDLVRASATSPGVAVFLRRAAGRTALVVVNLTDAALTNVALSTSEPVLAPGAYAATPLLGPPEARPVMIRAHGRLLGYVPFARLEPLGGYVVELSRLR